MNHARPRRVSVAVEVRAPLETVRNTYANYRLWPDIFPTISGVRRIGTRGLTVMLEVDHAEGCVLNELTLTAPDCLELTEMKRHYDAT